MFSSLYPAVSLSWMRQLQPLIDPKRNTELINKVLMWICCSITCYLNHPAQFWQAIRFLSYVAHLFNLLCHFGSHPLSTFGCHAILLLRVCPFVLLFRISDFSLPSVAHFYVLSEFSWMSQSLSAAPLIRLVIKMWMWFWTGDQSQLVASPGVWLPCRVKPYPCLESFSVWTQALYLAHGICWCAVISRYQWLRLGCA